MCNNNNNKKGKTEEKRTAFNSNKRKIGCRFSKLSRLEASCPCRAQRFGGRGLHSHRYDLNGAVPSAPTQPSAPSHPPRVPPGPAKGRPRVLCLVLMINKLGQECTRREKTAASGTAPGPTPPSLPRTFAFPSPEGILLSLQDKRLKPPDGTE